MKLEKLEKLEKLKKLKKLKKLEPIAFLPSIYLQKIILSPL